MKVEDVMSEDLIVGYVPGTVKEALKTLAGHNVSGMPILKKDTKKVVGILTRSDIFKNADESQLALIMSNEIYSVDRDEDIKKAAREFCEKELTPELALESDKKEEFPMELYRKAAKLGFTSMRFPEEYDGQGYGLLEDCLVIEEMCRADPGLGVAVWSGTFALPDLVFAHGTEEQKVKYIPPLCRGEKVSAGAFTEPEHGSDLSLMDTTAVRNGDSWVINGDKQFITNAPVADFFCVLGASGEK